jgi:hypothetical protein
MNTDRKKLYKVSVSYETVVYGTEKEIPCLVREAAKDDLDTCDPELSWEEVSSTKDLDEGWLDCLPWQASSSSPFTTSIRAFLEKEASDTVLLVNDDTPEDC